MVIYPRCRVTSPAFILSLSLSLSLSLFPLLSFSLTLWPFTYLLAPCHEELFVPANVLVLEIVEGLGLGAKKRKSEMIQSNNHCEGCDSKRRQKTLDKKK